MKHDFEGTPLSKEDIKSLIEKGLEGSVVDILDPRDDGVHLQAIIKYKGFKDKSLIEQHRMVYKALGESFNKEQIHALSIVTKSE
ncbi:MAG: BolA/IbaG family iron-sulfur metabolism protein [Nanoarchaeota archaeon]